MVSRILPLVALTVSVAGCRTVDNSSSAPLGLVVPQAEAWPNATIPVCWTTPGFEAEKQFIEAVIVREYNGRTGLKFTDFVDCPNNREGRLAVAISPTSHPNMTEGYNAYAHGEMSDFTWGKEGFELCRSSEYMQQLCMNNISLHEFGHAAGLVHEQEREDSRCDQHRGWPHANQRPVGRYDSDSIMDACNPSYFGEVMQLSPGDIQAINTLYPPADGGNGGRGDSNGTDSVILTGSGYVEASFNPPMTGSTLWISFVSGCHGPWTGNLYVDGQENYCDNCPEEENVWGPWEFRLGGVTTVSKIGANIGDGSCAYRATIR